VVESAPLAYMRHSLIRHVNRRCLPIRRVNDADALVLSIRQQHSGDFLGREKKKRGSLFHAAVCLRSTAQSTRNGIKAIIDEALDWERRSGAKFEADKTAAIHFTCKAYKANSEPSSSRVKLFSRRVTSRSLG